MSFRSALSNPTVSSGNVGQILLSSNTASASLVSGFNTGMANLTLPSGVWHMMSASSVVIAGATMTVLNVQLTSSSVVFHTETKIQQTLTPNTTTTAAALQFSESCVIVLTAETVISYKAYSVFVSGTVVVDNPITTSGAYITATKLA